MGCPSRHFHAQLLLATDTDSPAHSRTSLYNKPNQRSAQRTADAATSTRNCCIFADWKSHITLDYSNTNLSSAGSPPHNQNLPEWAGGTSHYSSSTLCWKTGQTVHRKGTLCPRMQARRRQILLYCCSLQPHSKVSIAAISNMVRQDSRICSGSCDKPLGSEEVVR
jgi:hypothetical protein